MALHGLFRCAPNDSVESHNFSRTEARIDVQSSSWASAWLSWKRHISVKSCHLRLVEKITQYWGIEVIPEKPRVARSSLDVFGQETGRTTLAFARNAKSRATSPLVFSLGSIPCCTDGPGTLYCVGLRQLFQFLPSGLVDVFFPRGFCHVRFIHFFFNARE